ncbi:mitochondrial deoxynucleotide carrier [Myxozyma melibiosi]|uniref:Mitochondrial deoxynucleotide carrier n=1 Tax=Myxozyma melibiosi TaxID=54550 RepID=A0ABR1FCE4_9ASCO
MPSAALSAREKDKTADDRACPGDDSHERARTPSSRESMICGGIAGLTSRFFVAPLDVVKIRQQLETHSLRGAAPRREYSGILSSLYKIYKTEGLTALWRGNLPAELLYLVYGSCQFAVYSHIQNNLSPLDIPDAAKNFVSGACAGATATAVTYPLDLLRTRFAAQGDGAHRVYKSLRHALLQIHKDEGLTGYFRGLRPAIAQIVPYMGFFFASYQPCKLAMSSLEHEYGVNTFGSGDAIAGMIAGIVSKTCVFPLDVLRRRLQVQGPTREKYVLAGVPTYPNSIVGCARAIVKNEGPRALYRGLWVALVKSAPTSAITMWTFESSLIALRWFDNKMETLKA